MLDATPNTDGLAEQIQADVENLDSDPEFVAEFMKMQFVEDIFRAMHEQGINRNQLATKLGKSRQYVGRILNENANFTLETLAEIACALDMHVAARLYFKDEYMVIQSFPNPISLLHFPNPETLVNQGKQPNYTTEQEDVSYSAA